MCRIAAEVSPVKQYFGDMLAETSKSLLKQSNANARRLQKDGWGIGWYQADKLKIRKSPHAVYLEKNRFASACGDSASRISIAHIRLASNPKKLPPEKLCGETNTQPFGKGRILFAHNGTLNIPDDAKKAFLKGPSARPRGNNDSEVLFLIFMRQYNITGSLAEALAGTRADILRLWCKIRPRRKQWKAPYKGLNIFVSDGKTLAVMCDFSMEQEIYSLLTRGWEYGRIAYAFRKGRLVVASEPLDRGKWRKMPAQSILTAAVKHGAVESEILSLPELTV